MRVYYNKNYCYISCSSTDNYYLSHNQYLHNQISNTLQSKALKSMPAPLHQILLNLTLPLMQRHCFLHQHLPTRPRLYRTHCLEMLRPNFNILGCDQEVYVVGIDWFFKQLGAVTMQGQFELLHAFLTHLVVFDELDGVGDCPLLAFLFAVALWASQPVGSIVLFLVALLHALVVVVLQLVLFLHRYVE